MCCTTTLITHSCTLSSLSPSCAGLNINNNLEITNCFPSPGRGSSEEEGDDGGARFQFEMLKCLREVNVDHLQVGWYQTTILGAHLTRELIETQYDHQKQIEESVVLIYDPVRTAQGSLSLRAFRLSKQFMETWEGKDFSSKNLRDKGITFENVFREVPVVIRSSHLARALLHELGEEQNRPTRKPQQQTHDFEQLDITSHSFLERNVRSLMDCVDGLQEETQKYHYYMRNVNRQEAQKKQYLDKLKLENANRQEKGQEPLSEADMPGNVAFKPIPAPSRLESLLITGQINHYCGQISQFASSNYGKLFLAQCLQSK
jgi:translation initiation factor 3 subunit H